MSISMTLTVNGVQTTIALDDPRVTLLDRHNQVIEHLGDDSASKWRDTRTQARDHFLPGKFVCPHGACFDHAGNIFVVEWVEVGRVTKLRKV